MHEGHYIFSQIMAHLPWKAFQRRVHRCRGDYKVHSFRCTHQYRAMAIAQLAHLCRLRLAPDQPGPAALRPGRQRTGSAGNNLCAGLIHHCAVPVAVSMGAVSKDQVRHQAAHPAGSAGQYPVFYRNRCCPSPAPFASWTTPA